MSWYLGIDIGSSTSKGVLFKDGQLQAHFLTASGNNYKNAALKVRDTLINQVGISEKDIGRTVSTGHGADIMPFKSEHIPDAKCCANGIHHILPEVRTVIDVQEQTCQVMRISDKGGLLDLVKGDKCASGSGGFITIIANVLQVDLEEVGPLSTRSENPVVFSTGCAVFGESEAVSRVAEGIAKEDILAGIHQMLSNTIIKMANRLGIRPPCAISGGGGLNVGLTQYLEKMVDNLIIPRHPELVNAVGAAVLARNSSLQAK